MSVPSSVAVLAFMETQLITRPEIDELEKPPGEGDTKDYRGISYFILSMSILLAYWLVYKPEFIAAIYNTTVTTIGNLTALVRNFLGLQTGG